MKKLLIEILAELKKLNAHFEINKGDLAKYEQEQTEKMAAVISAMPENMRPLFEGLLGKGEK